MRYISLVGEKKTAHLDDDDKKAFGSLVGRMSQEERDSLEKQRQEVIDEAKSLNMKRIEADNELATIWKRYGYYNPASRDTKSVTSGPDVRIPDVAIYKRWQELNRIVNGATYTIGGGLKFKYRSLSKELGEDPSEVFKEWNKLTPEPRKVFEIQLQLEKDYKAKRDKERQEEGKRIAKSGEDDLIDNWSVVNPSLFDLYSYDKYKEIKPEIIDRFVMSKSIIKGKPNTFAINFLASKLPKSVIDEVYDKYGLKKLLLGLTYITATIIDKDAPMMFDEASLPGAKLNKEYQAFIKPMIESKNNVGYDKIIKYLK